MTEPSGYTWNDLMTLARDEVLAHRIVALVQSGQQTREQVLTSAVIWLLHERRQMVDAEIKQRANEVKPRITRAKVLDV